jgi:hypothetical protein
MEDVAFCLNHASAHRITEDYIKKDFSTVYRVNRKVIDRIFSGDSMIQKSPPQALDSLNY